MEDVTLDGGWLHSQDVANKGDEALHVRFYMRPRLDQAATKEAGRPIHKDVEYVTINKPGDRLDTTDCPAKDSHRRRFPRHYAAFKAKDNQHVSGTLLSKWPLIQASQVEDLKYFNVFTVEQLSMMPDGNIPNVGNISHLKKQAADYLAAASGQAPTVALRAENEALKTRMEAMEAMMARLAESSAPVELAPETIDEAAPKKRGRPAKQAQAQE